MLSDEVKLYSSAINGVTAYEDDDEKRITVLNILNYIKINKPEMIWTPKVGLEKSRKTNGVFIIAKLTKEDKIKIIQLYNEGYGCDIIVRKTGVVSSLVKEIKKQYDLYGDIVYLH